jgi:hypothetical protein
MAEKVKKAQTRDYIVLRSSAPRLYALVGTFNAGSPEQAIRKGRDELAATGRDPVPVETFHAVPTRNWTVQDAVTEQPPPQTRLTQGVLPGAEPDPPETTSLHVDNIEEKAA